MEDAHFQNGCLRESRWLDISLTTRETLIKNMLFVDNTDLYMCILWITIFCSPGKWYEANFIDTLIGYVSPNFSYMKITCLA